MTSSQPRRVCRQLDYAHRQRSCETLEQAYRRRAANLSRLHRRSITETPDETAARESAQRDRDHQRHWRIFTALYGMQTRSSDENSVRLSVRQTRELGREEKSVHIFIPYERTFSLVFLE